MGSIFSVRVSVNRDQSPNAAELGQGRSAVAAQRPQPEKAVETPKAATAPDGPFLRDCSEEAAVWKMYMGQATVEDEKLANILNSDLDPLLIFAALFSAILAAFLIEVRKGLQEDLQNITNLLLTILVENQHNLTSAQLPSQSRFEPSGPSRWVNGLWFASLMFSLMSALGASLAKGWITQFSLADSGLYRSDAEAHHLRLTGMRRWHVKWIIQYLSLLIHIAFFLFGAGLALLLFKEDIVIGALIACLTALVFSLYISSTIHPVHFTESPFRTPLSDMLRRVFRHSSALIAGSSEPPTDADALRARALAWLMTHSLDVQVIKMSIRAIAGLPYTDPVQAELLLASVLHILSRGLSDLMEDQSDIATLTSHLYAILHLVQIVQQDSDRVAALHKTLQSLVKPGGALSMIDSLAPGIREIALCVRGRIVLLICHQWNNTMFDTDMPILMRSCPDAHLHYNLRAVLMLFDKLKNTMSQESTNDNSST